MFARTASVLVLGGTLIAGLAACGSTATTAAAQPKAGSPVAGAAAGTPAHDTAVQAPAAKVSTAAAPSANCPVTTDTLVAVLKAKYHKLPAGHEVSDVRCYQGYAIATRSAAQSDNEVAVFRYASGSWQYLIGGSADYCTGVPAKVKKHFRGAAYPGCN